MQEDGLAVSAVNAEDQARLIIEGNAEMCQERVGRLGEELENVLHVFILFAFKNWVEMSVLVVRGGCKSGGVDEGHDGTRGC